MNLAESHEVSFEPEHAPSRSLPTPFLRRSHLERRLTDSSARLRLLLAPPGFGKTVLMTSCAALVSERVVWVELNGDSLTFEELVQLIGEKVLGPGEKWTESKLTCALQNYASKTVVILDDWPRAKSQELDAGLGRLLAIQSPCVSWWISSRRRPECGFFARLVLRGDYLELGIDELAFSKDETAALSKLYDPQAGEMESKAFQFSKGWPAAITFYCRPADEACSSDPVQLIRDYLHCEVVEYLQDGQREIFLQLARLRYFNKNLCEHLWGSYGVVVLDELLSLGTLISPVHRSTGKWFEVLPIAAKALSSDDASQELRALHRQACQSFITQDEIGLAIDQAIAAEDFDIAASLIGKLDERDLINPEIGRKLLAYNKSLPSELLNCTSKLASTFALVFAATNRLADARSSLHALDKFLPASSAPEQSRTLGLWLGISGIVEHCEGNSELAAERCRSALLELENVHTLAKFAFWTIPIQQELFLGNLKEAENLIQQALTAAQDYKEIWPQNLIVFYQSMLMESKGQLVTALNTLERQITAQERRHAIKDVAYPRLLIRRAYVLMSLGRMRDAYEDFEQGADLCEDILDPFLVHARIGLFKLAIFEGKTAAAEQQLSQAETWLRENDVTSKIYRFDIQQCRAILGSTSCANTSVHSALLLHKKKATDSGRQCLPFHTAAFRYETDRVVANAHASQGMICAAVDSLKKSLECSTQSGFALSAIDIRLSIAELELLRGHDGIAFRLAKTALQMAESLEYHLPMELLRRSQSRLVNIPADSKLLSRREIEVLRLIEEGHSNQEIANLLVLSVFTVKSHIQRITGKLDVSRRTQAVARAKALGLLER